MSAPQPGPPATGPRATPRLTRSRDDRVIAGVAGGLGHHLGVDPVIIRIAFVVLALAGGSGVLAYLLAWLIIPEEDGDRVTATAAAGGSSVVAGLVLISLGALLLADRFLPVFSWRFVGPTLLIALGVLLIVRTGGDR